MVIHKRQHPKQHKDHTKHRKNIFDTILTQASKSKKNICFPEVEDDRILKGASILAKKKIVNVHLLGDPKQIQQRMKKLKLPLTNITIISTTNKEHDFTQEVYKLRKKKGLTRKGAAALLEQPIYYATMLLKTGHIDGIVYGAMHPSSETYRPALQLIKTKKGVNTASSYFIELVDNKTLFYADCAFNINPDAKQLAQIALSTAESVAALGYTPKVAFLSFSTKGSAQHELLNKIRVATQLVKRKQPKLKVDGELQVDAALVPEIAKSKAPGSAIKGDANILIFPDLNAGNIAYKLTQRLAHARVIGPISQGIALPVNDLSRGCSVEEVVEVAAMTAIQAQQPEKTKK